jgi:outer membrane protein TolC
MAELDILQARSEYAAREEEVIVAERAVADNENFLKQLITDEISRVLDLKLRIAPPMLPDTGPVTLNKDLGKAFELRPDFRQALLDIQKRQINVVFTRNQALPRLDLLASMGVNGIDTDFARSFNRASGAEDTLTLNAGAVFSVPIPNRDARGQLQVSKLETARALIDLKRLEQDIFVRADNAAGQIETTRKRIEATREARRFAQETLAAGQSRLAAGTSTTFEVLQFQRDLAVAEASELRARADYVKAVAQYALQVGSTLERNGIILE